MNMSVTSSISKRFRRTESPAQAVTAPVNRAVTAPAIPIPPHDPLYAVCIKARGTVELETLKIESPTLQQMRTEGVHLILPLVNQGEIVGMLQLGNRMSDQEYSSDDTRLLGNLAPQASAALRVAQLAYLQQIEAARRERIENELRVAGIIQQTLLPKEVPLLPGWQLAAHWQPARSVGGDFYDFIYLRDGRLMITIGDVTDKGVPAALVMASTRSILRSVADTTTSPGEMLRRANDVLFPDMPPKMFVTCLCAVLDSSTGRMVYANAGHNPSQQRTAKGVVELRARGMPLGLMPDMYYEEKETVLAEHDVLLLYSDGLVEAHNPTREMFGMKRLQTLMQDATASESLLEALRDALFDFTGADWEQEDDVTLVVVQRGDSSQSGKIMSTWHILDEFDAPSIVGGERALMERVASMVQAQNILSKARLERLKTAVAETAMNAMEHGNHYQTERLVHVRVAFNPRELRVAITDQGGGQPQTETITPDLEAKLEGKQSTRGWGLFLIKTMVDDMRSHQTDTQHTVELVMKLEGENHV
jgi:serine phosphatase RsbU (regulator of sigma subunit)/anti-sigma regulatory factor (Ser/Thr protein kinase)